MRRAAKEGKLPQRTLAERRAAAARQGVITQAELEHLERTDRLRREVIRVDDFEHDLSRADRQGGAPWQEPRRKAAVESL